MNMHLLYSSFWHIPVLQGSSLHTESGSLLLCSIPGLVSIAWWSKLKGSWEKCLWCHAELGTHPWGLFQLSQAEGTQAWVLFSIDCAVPTGLPCARCLPLGRSWDVGQRSLGFRENCVSRSDTKWCVLATLGSIQYLVVRWACQSWNHRP